MHGRAWHGVAWHGGCWNLVPAQSAACPAAAAPHPPTPCAAGSEEDRARTALAVLVSGFELNSLHPQTLAHLLPGLRQQGCNSTGREMLAAALHTIWPPPASAAAQLEKRGWLPSAPSGSASSTSPPASAGHEGSAAPTTALASSLGALLWRHRPDVPLAVLHHACLVVLTMARRMMLEAEDNRSAAWQAELKQGLLEAQLLLNMAPAEPYHYLTASHFLEHAEWLDPSGFAAALHFTLQGAEVAKQCKGAWAGLGGRR